VRRIQTIRLIPLLLGVFSQGAAAVEQSSWKFVFDNVGKTGFIPIGPTNKYATKNGYGFDFGMDTAVQYTPKKDGIEGKMSIVDPTLASWSGDPFYLPARQAFFFSANVPRGDYEVKITLGSRDSVVRATIRAEQRRLMIEDWKIPAGGSQTRTIHVNRRSDTLAGTKTRISTTTREATYVDLDNRLTIEFNGDHPVLNELEITKIDTDITVYLAGNSTCVNQPQEPWSTWGANFPRFFKAGVTISDQAESGLTAQSFIAGRRLDNIVSTLKAGDFVFAEFGHNDAKDATATANYSSNLTKFVTAAKSKGATAVLVTPTARNIFSGTMADNSLLDPFVAQVKSVAAAQNVPYLDLNALSISLIEALTPSNSSKAYTYFPAYTVPGQGATALKDATHWNGYGGYELAKAMATLVKQKNLSFAKYLSDDYAAFDPSKPDAYNTATKAGFQLPFSPFLGAYKVPDSAVGPNLTALAHRVEVGAARIETSTYRERVLTLAFDGAMGGDIVRVFDLTGKVLVTGEVREGSEGIERLVLPERQARGVHLVELVRDGRILDHRMVLTEL